MWVVKHVSIPMDQRRIKPASGVAFSPPFYSGASRAPHHRQSQHVCSHNELALGKLGCCVDTKFDR